MEHREIARKDLAINSEFLCLYLDWFGVGVGMQSNLQSNLSLQGVFSTSGGWPPTTNSTNQLSSSRTQHTRPRLALYTSQCDHSRY